MPCHNYPETEGQSAQTVTNADNVNVRAIYRQQHRYNSTSDTCAVVGPESPHHDKTALFCANICKTDSPQQLRRLVIPMEHSNDPSVPTPSVAAWPQQYHCRRLARGSILSNRHQQE